MNKIAGTVILYHPDQEVLRNINSYIDQIDKLYIVDNSSIKSEFVQKEYKSNNKVVYIFNGKNIGIASALNIALFKAYEEGYEFFLTMDQDSYFEDKVIEKMITKINEDEKIGLVSAKHQYAVGKNESEKKQTLIDALVAMTSGNIVRVRLFRSLGGFKDDLFIDYVDHEICLRLNTLGYKVEILAHCKVIHSVGNVKERRILWRKVYPTNHNFIRHYYRTRNRLFVYKTYGEIFPKYLKLERQNFIKDVLKIILIEEQKWKKLKFIFWGYIDFKNNIFGVCKRT